MAKLNTYITSCHGFSGGFFKIEITANSEFVSSLSRSAVIMRSAFLRSESLKLIKNAPPNSALLQKITFHNDTLDNLFALPMRNRQ